MKNLAFVLMAVLWPFQLLWAQHQPIHTSGDSTQNLSSFVSRGHLHGHLRNYFMGTSNYKQLSDHCANGISAKIGWRSAELHGFSLGFSGLFTFNTFSTNLAEPDALAGSRPAFERQLFDLQHPDNTHDMDRLEELYLQYRWKGNLFRFGRQLIHSPFINPQDSRMKPYAVQGSWLSLNSWKPLQLQAGWINRFSPRSTTEWFRVGESIGIYSQGFDAEGNENDYADTLEVPGLMLLNLQPGLPKTLKADFWYYRVSALLQAAYLRLSYHQKPATGQAFRAGVEYVVESSLSDRHPVNQRYIPKGHQAHVWGAQLGYAWRKHDLSLNYLSIGEKQFLFPREWGREQFFATLPRGRMEGLANSQLLSLRYMLSPWPQFQLQLAAARYFLPAANDYQANKYGIPAGSQFNAELSYQFQGKLKGLQTKLLYVHRNTSESLPLAHYFYTAGYHHINWVTQLSF